MTTFLLLFFGFYQCCFCQISTEIKIIKEIVNTHQTRPYFAILGYDKYDNIELIRSLSSFGYQSVILNLTELHLSNLDPLENAILLLNLNAVISRDFLAKGNKNHLYEFPLKWILMNSNSSLTQSSTVFSYIQPLNILVDSNVILITKLADNNDYSLHKLFKRHLNGKIKVENYAKWTDEQQLTIFEKEDIAAVRRKNLHGTTLRTAIVVTHNDTLNHLHDYRDKHIDSITKVNYVLVKQLSEMINASLKYSIKNTWGYKTNMSTWTGMLGELTENRADIGGTPLFVTTDRVDIIDYIAMTTATKSTFVFRQPKLSYVANVFLLPFHWTVWLATIALVVTTTIGLCMTISWEKSIKEATECDLQPMDAAVVSFGAMCQQGASSVPEKAAGRIITLFIFVSLMFLYTSYSANIVALLQSSSNSIQTLADLLNSRLSVGVDDTVFNRFYFPAATEPVRRALYLRKVAPKNQEPRFFPIEKGVKLLRQGLFAFHMEGGSGYKIVGETFYEDEKCDLQEISFLQVPDPWLAIQKNSSYKELLKIGLRKIQESGLQAREVSKVYTKKPFCHGTASSFISVGMIDIYAAIVVFISGIINASVVFLVEIFVHKKKSEIK